MIKDIDQSHTSWLIYSDYLEENGQLALAEQVRFELDYKPCNFPPPFGGKSVDVGGYGDNIVYGGYSGVGSNGIMGGQIAGLIGSINDYVGSHYD